MTRQQKERIHYLLLRFMADEAGAGERMELSGLLKEGTDTATWEELLEEIYQAESATQEYKETEWQPVLDQLLEQNRGNGGDLKPLNKRIRLTARRMAVAASILLVIALGGYFLFFHRPARQNDIAIAETKDIKAPENNRAMITLADGRKVYLDSAGNGQLAVQGNIKLVKLANGQIAYETTTGEAPAEIKYNTLTNPRGSKVIDMALADGSHVWLNAGSSVTYPVAFVGNNRRVSITGEAYFEVAHDLAKPFYVMKGDMQVEVLGTHFNVNAYDDEDAVRVTLLEGSVRVSQGTERKMLRPEQQAVIIKNAQETNNNGQITVNKSVDLEEIMAWREEQFLFSDMELAVLLRQVARWYDVEVRYEGKASRGKLGGGLSRNLPLSKMMELLGANGVHLKLEGRTLIVL